MTKDVMRDSRIPAGGDYKRVPVAAGWKPTPPMFGVGQVIRVVYDGVEQTATVTSADWTGHDNPTPVHLYLPDSDEYVWVVLDDQ